MYSLELKYNKKHVVTYVILAITTVVWLSQVFLFGSQTAATQNLLNSGALWGWQIIQYPDQIWRLVTPIFVHLSWSHFLMNMITLLMIGRMIEEEFGSLRYAEIYLLSGIFANALTFFISPDTLAAGASTSLFGIFGAMGTLGYFTNSPRLKQIGQGFLILIAANLMLNFFQSGVSIVGHIGGVLGGGLLAGAWPPARYKKWVPRNVQIICALLTIVLFVMFIVLTFSRLG
ncbi:MAG: rhomboid family intramembrane serine protease [Streptococcaceae bacterium]|nr:rhomboid family intramembrane serine protease [Streptococcaceae bacterium]